MRFGRRRGFGVVFAKNEAVIKKEINNHNYDVSKNKNACTFDKIVIKGETDTCSDMVGKIIDWAKESKEPG